MENTRDRNSDLRAAFAKAALQGFTANPYWMRLKVTLARQINGGDADAASRWLKRELAEDAAEVADEMIEYLEEYDNSNEKRQDNPTV